MQESLATIWTIGHSTRSSDEFNQILKAHKISRVVDVRSFPGSRRYPHFNQSALATSLAVIGVEYHHLASLGGRRRPSKNSKNTAWKNPSFRAYADHMESDEFRAGIETLLELGCRGQTALMCAEAVWWRCHRSLIADYLKANELKVVHIIDANKTEDHSFTSAARIVEGKLSYQGLIQE